MTLRDQYGTRYKTLCEPGEGGSYEIVGKYGYIRMFGHALELYLSRPKIERRIERNYPAFKPKNHYDDATAFTFANQPDLVASAAKWIKARNRKQFTPEQRLAMAARLRALTKHPREASNP